MAGSKTMESDEPALMTKTHLRFLVALKPPQQSASCVQFSGMTYSADMYISEFYEGFLLGSMLPIWTY